MDSDQALVVPQKADGCLRTKPTPFPKWDSDRWNDPLHRSTSRGSSPVLPPQRAWPIGCHHQSGGQKEGGAKSWKGTHPRNLTGSHRRKYQSSTDRGFLLSSFGNEVAESIVFGDRFSQVG